MCKCSDVKRQVYSMIYRLKQGRKDYLFWNLVFFTCLVLLLNIFLISGTVFQFNCHIHQSSDPLSRGLLVVSVLSDQQNPAPELLPPRRPLADWLRSLHFYLLAPRFWWDTLHTWSTVKCWIFFHRAPFIWWVFYCIKHFTLHTAKLVLHNDRLSFVFFCNRFMIFYYKMLPEKNR